MQRRLFHPDDGLEILQRRSGTMSFLAAAIQLNAGADKPANLNKAERLVESAARSGAQFVALPEMFACFGEPETIVSSAEPMDGEIASRMSRLAARWQLTLAAGSFAVLTANEQLVTNTSLLFGPDGAVLSRYDKLHLFDIELTDGVQFRESSFIRPGERISVAATPLGRVGQATCYDLRFPELFRALLDAGADFFCVPAAFTLSTGRDHWEALLRARAIENLCYVVASNQYGRHTRSLTSYGRSMIIDPWGVPLATAADGEGVILAEIDLAKQEALRRQLPALQHRRRLPVSEPDAASPGGLRRSRS